MAMGNPNRLDEGQGPQRLTAYDLRHRFQWLNQFSDDELRRIALCDESTQLQDGAVYFDISDPERGQLIARGDESMTAGSCFVWRGAVSEQIWQKLLDYGKFRQMGR